MPGITNLPGGEATTLSDTDNLIVEPSGGQTKYAAFSALLSEVNDEFKKGCRVVATEDQSIAASAWAALTFDTEAFDYGGFHSTIANTSRITIPAGEGGLYLVGGTVLFTADAVGYRGLRITLGGSAILATSILPSAIAAAGSALHIATVYVLSAAEYLELEAYHTSTTDPLDTDSDSIAAVHFWALKMAEV